MFNQIDFGKRLREFRKRTNLTQKEAARKIGVSEQALSKWENGDCLPDVYNLRLLALVLHVSVDAYIRDYFMPAHGFKMAENGAQELEVFDTSEHKSGYAYMPVMRQ